MILGHKKKNKQQQQQQQKGFVTSSSFCTSSSSYTLSFPKFLLPNKSEPSPLPSSVSKANISISSTTYVSSSKSNFKSTTTTTSTTNLQQDINTLQRLFPEIDACTLQTSPIDNSRPSTTTTTSDNINTASANTATSSSSIWSLSYLLGWNEEQTTAGPTSTSTTMIAATTPAVSMPMPKVSTTMSMTMTGLIGRLLSIGFSEAIGHTSTSTTTLPPLGDLFKHLITSSSSTATPPPRLRDAMKPVLIACRAGKILGAHHDILQEGMVRALRSAAEDISHFRICTSMSIDELAAIKLYTASADPPSTGLYFILNRVLRAADRQAVKPFVPIIWLLMHALKHTPAYTRTILFRGVAEDLSHIYNKSSPNMPTVCWPSFTSCTSTVEVLRNPDFLGTSGRLDEQCISSPLYDRQYKSFSISTDCSSLSCIAVHLLIHFYVDQGLLIKFHLCSRNCLFNRMGSFYGEPRPIGSRLEYTRLWAIDFHKTRFRPIAVIPASAGHLRGSSALYICSDVAGIAAVLNHASG
eukprot:gene3389-6725_t